MSPEDPTHRESISATTMHPNLARGLAVERALAKLPMYGAATIRTSADTGYSTINASLSSRSDELKTTRQFEQTYAVGDQQELLYTGPCLSSAQDTAFSSLSPDSHLIVRFRNIDKKRIIEVSHCESGVVAELDVGKEHASFLSGCKPPTLDTEAHSKLTIVRPA